MGGGKWARAGRKLKSSIVLFVKIGTFVVYLHSEYFSLHICIAVFSTSYIYCLLALMEAGG